MIDRGKFSILGIGVNVIDYEGAVERIVAAAEARRGLSVSALAVHGVMTGVLSRDQRIRLNRLDLVVPDGQPVRWGLNALHGSNLQDRVYGPTLTLKTCSAAAALGLPIYLYGSTPEVLGRLKESLKARCPGLKIAGVSASSFRLLTPAEAADAVDAIRSSGAAIVFVGLGCPRQETWAYENRDKLGMPVIAVGAAFDLHAGTLSQAPSWMQNSGLEWAYRLWCEPMRLWKRYVLLNPAYVFLLALQAAKILPFQVRTETQVLDDVRHG